MRFGSIFFLFLTVVFCQIFLGCQSQPVWKDLSLDNPKKAQAFFQGMKDINSTDEDVQGLGRAPIHMAIDRKDDTLVEFIIALKADVNLMDQKGRTPLWITWENFEELNRREAEQQAILKRENWGMFRRQAEKKLAQIDQERIANNKIARLLVEARADIHENNSLLAGNILSLAGNILNRREEYFFAILTPYSVNATNFEGKTLLHLAAEMEKYPAIPPVTATDDGRAIDKQDDTGKTALDIALNRPERINAIKTAEQLILAGARSENPVFRYLEPALKNSNYNIVVDPDGTTPLHYAAAHNYHGFVQYLLEKKADPNIRSAEGATPFHEAVRKGHLDIMRTLLLSRGTDINARDSQGNTAMHLAVPLEWHREVLSFLLDRGADPNIQNEQGNTALHSLISRRRDAELIRRLLSGGADVSIRNNEGKTPLYLAVQTPQYLTAQENPLYLAVQENMVPYIAVLLSYNSDIFAADNREITPLDWAIRNKSPALPALITAETVHYRDGAGNTILHKAIENHGDTELIRLIMEKGALVNARNDAGDTSLHVAIRQDERESGIFLLSSPYQLELFNANVVGETPLSLIFNAPGGLREWALTPAALAVRDGLGRTMLHYAASWKLNTHIPTIIKNGAALEAKNAAGETPLFEAVKVDAPATTRTLIVEGAALSARNNQGDTLLHTAIHWNALAAAETLIKAGADIDALNGINQKAPLHDAVRLGMSRFERLLIDNHADLEARDNEGLTPLMEALRLGATGSAAALLSAGADPRTRDARGNTPLHTAVTTGRLDLVTLILDRLDRLPLILDREPDIHVKNLSGKSPFQLALEKTGSPQILQALLTGDRIQTADRNGLSLLHIAVEEGAALDMLDLILKRGGSVAALDSQGRPPLHLAMDRGAWGTAEKLVDNGADVFARAMDGKIPANMALDNGPAAIQALFSGVTINARDRQGDTILHYAARHISAGEDADKKTIESIGLLLILGANKNTRNQAGKSPLQIARESNRSIAIIRLLD
jgi:ankyrin repeat protein